jgi:hypothetical protein
MVAFMASNLVDPLDWLKSFLALWLPFDCSEKLDFEAISGRWNMQKLSERTWKTNTV